ncbi:MAG TPA: pitrilysin family protein [Thermoanaerobaculia bacterium]|nr:pitrilysin family protein [Thermoanaerobaculia bacterium]
MTRIGAALLFVAFAAVGQQVTTPPAPSAPRQPHIPQPVEKTLANGLRMIVVTKHDVPLVSARLMVRTGSEADAPDLAGVAELTASLLTKGTKSRPAEEIARGVEALGATIESDAAFDESWVKVSVMSPNLAKAMDFVADVVRNPSFKGDEIERLRQQDLDALRVALQDPLQLAQFIAPRVVFGEAPYGHNVGGTPESLAKIQRDAIVAFHHRYYRPDNSVLVVAGDVRPEDVFATGEKFLGTWSSMEQRLQPVPSPAEAGAPSPPRVVVIDMPDAGQAAVVVTRKGLRRADPRYFAAIVANSVLGGGYSSRLNEEVRVKRGLSYGAGSGFDLRRDVGPFTASTQTKNPSAAEVAGIIVDEMNRMATGELPDTELTPRKATLIGNFGRSLETSGGLADRISFLALHGLPLDEINRYIAGVQAITPEQVRQFAGANLNASVASVVIVGDAKQFLDALKKRFENVEVIPAAQVDLNVPTLKARGPS